MARLGCYCGAEMTNTVAPSKNILKIFYYSEAEDAIRENPTIRLWDFYTGWDEKNECNNSFMKRIEPVEYWKCSACKRVYEVQAQSCGQILRAYKPQEKFETESVNISNLKELLVLKDVEMDELLSEDARMTLDEYLKKRKPFRYFISEDEETAFMVSGDNEIVGAYKQSQKPLSEE